MERVPPGQGLDGIRARFRYFRASRSPTALKNDALVIASAPQEPAATNISADPRKSHYLAGLLRSNIPFWPKQVTSPCVNAGPGRLSSFDEDGYTKNTDLTSKFHTSRTISPCFPGSPLLATASEGSPPPLLNESTEGTRGRSQQRGQRSYTPAVLPTHEESDPRYRRIQSRPLNQSRS